MIFVLIGGGFCNALLFGGSPFIFIFIFVNHYVKEVPFIFGERGCFDILSQEPQSTRHTKDQSLKRTFAFDIFLSDNLTTRRLEK